MNDTTKPCFWMRVALNRFLEGRLRGPVAWYTRHHLAKCPQCSATYKMMLAVRSGFRRLGQDVPDDWIVGEEKWREIERLCTQSERED